MIRHRLFIAALAAMTALVAATADAQPLGTLTWRLEPFCNLVTVNVTQNGAVYTMDGYDDLCGAGQRAPLVGLATPNPDGSIGIGWNIVVDGVGIHVGGRITLAGLGGPWSDSAGNSGHFVFGTATSGTPRPVPAGTTTIPPAFALLTDGSFVSRGAINAGAIPAAGAGTRMVWHAGKSAFRAGSVPAAEWDQANVGTYSTAFGYGTTASGNYSTAMGNSTRASGGSSTAMGNLTVALGSNSTAMGVRTTASGVHSTAMGNLTTASGESSTAMGSISTAAGRYSTAMGLGAHAAADNSTAIGTSLSAAGGASVVMGVRAATTSTGNGSFVYGDQSTGQSGSVVTSSAANQFLARASGGVQFYTNATLTSGLQLAAGGSQWLGVSDVNMKHAFEELDGDEVLARLAHMPVMAWSYKAQDPSIRHVGPTAQDFSAAFGLGEDPLRIGTMDADGIALAGVKALDRRTRATNDAMARQNDLLTREIAELRARLARLEAVFEGLYSRAVKEPR